MMKKRHLLMLIWILIGILLLILVFIAAKNVSMQKTLGSIVTFYVIGSGVMAGVLYRMKKNEDK